MSAWASTCRVEELSSALRLRVYRILDLVPCRLWAIAIRLPLGHDLFKVQLAGRPEQIAPMPVEVGYPKQRARGDGGQAWATEQWVVAGARGPYYLSSDD